MLLSIVMMIKNEEKYLDTTLKSLDPLMNNIKSELIILDTGSTDRSIEIAKKYTDKVYFEKWYDNFAQMRNLSIKHASGEWILILDADEELVNCEILIDFFKNGGHKKYNSASIELTNIMSDDRTIFNKASIVRLFKKDKDFRYEGAIHEQPIYKEPTFNDIANFNHYGYMYKNEEVKQKKLNRNEKILLSELKANPNNPYVCYQLAMNYSAFGEKEEALIYMEKCHEIYNKSRITYSYVISGLAKLYIELNEHEKCEKICKDYIKNDNKNIDIYCYIAISQNNLKKYKESLDNYNRYLYLLDNYEISTQANDLYSVCDTISFRENAKLDMINIYYNLGMYEKVEIESKKINSNQASKIYNILFMSLVKLKKEYEIVNMYMKKELTITEKNIFKSSIETMLLNIPKSDKKNLFKVFANIEDNYGLLNKIRLGEKLNLNELIMILSEEKENYYGDIIYFGFKEYDLNLLLEEIDFNKIEMYFEYLINNRRDFILDLYEYLINQETTLDINKLKFYVPALKQILIYGNLEDEKYINLFLMYIMYGYDYLRLIYNDKLNEDELVEFINDKDQKLIINIVRAQRIKELDKIKYLKIMKSLLISNINYRKGLEFLILNFEKDFNEDLDMKILKKQFKSMIELSINQGNIKEAEQLLIENEFMFENDIQILNIKAIIKISTQDFKEAERILKQAYMLDVSNLDTIFNIAYVKECLMDIEESEAFYKKIIKDSTDFELLSICKNEIDKLNENYKDFILIYQIKNDIDLYKFIEFKIGKNLTKDNMIEYIKNFNGETKDDVIVFISICYRFFRTTQNYEFDLSYETFKNILYKNKKLLKILDKAFIKRQPFFLRNIIQILLKLDLIVCMCYKQDYSNAFKLLEKLNKEDFSCILNSNLLEKFKNEYFYSRELENKVKKRMQINKDIKEYLKYNDLNNAENLLNIYNDNFEVDIEYNLNKFEILKESKDIKSAEEVMEDCLNKQLLNAEVFYNIGWIYENKNDCENALKFYKKAINICFDKAQLEVIKTRIEYIQGYEYYEQNTNKAKVSIVITSYNQKLYLKEAIESFLKQDYENLEIIVSDDCSIDGTDEMMQLYKNESRVRYIRHENNLGAGINSLHSFYNYVDGKYVMIFNHDDFIISKDYISKAVKLLEENENLSMVFANVKLMYEGKIINKTNVNIDTINNGHEYFMNYGSTAPHITGILTTVFRRKYAVEMGILTENTKSKDLFIHLKMMLRGDVGFIKEEVAVYRIHQQSISYNMPNEYDFYTIEELEKLKNTANEYIKDKNIDLNLWLFNSITAYISWRLSMCSNKKHKEEIIEFLKLNYFIVYKKLLTEQKEVIYE